MVCKQLGFKTGRERPLKRKAKCPEKAVDKFRVSSVLCSGREDNIAECLGSIMDESKEVECGKDFNPEYPRLSMLRNGIAS